MSDCETCRALSAEVARLKSDARDARMALATVILAAGGEVKIRRRDIETCPMAVITRTDDPMTLEVVLTAELPRQPRTHQPA